jgi:hypothetical protein
MLQHDSFDLVTVLLSPTSADQARLRTLFAAFVFVFHSCWIFVASNQLLLDGDTFWHVQLGHDIWQSGKFPVQDQYSYTFFGRPWMAKEWLSQVIYYWAYATGGWNLVVIVATMAISSAIMLLFHFLSTRLRATVAIAIALVASFAASGTYLARPHVLTFPLIVVWTEYLMRASEEDRAPSFWLLPVISLWSNLHASFPIGLVIAAISFLNFAERNRFSRMAEMRTWLLFLLACGLATLVNPYGYRVLLLTLHFMQANEAVPYISEWRPLVFADLPPHEFLVMFMLGCLLYFGLTLRVAKILLLLIMLHFFLQHVRFAYLFYYLVPLVVSYEIGAQHARLSFAAWTAEQDDPVTRFLQRHAGLMTAALASIGAVVTAGFLFLADVEQKPKIAPSAALSYARSTGLTGHVLNYYDFGGFLIFNGIRTFIDGRADQIFDGGFMDAIAATQKPGGGAALVAQLKKYDIAWTLLPPTDPRVFELDRLPGWKRAYSDEFAVIHVPER